MDLTALAEAVGLEIGPFQRKIARFEENAGRTNTSLIRLEGHAQ